jgi:hypothetical protein
VNRLLGQLPLLGVAGLMLFMVGVVVINTMETEDIKVVYGISLDLKIVNYIRL